MHHLGVGGAFDTYENAYMCADGSLKIGEHRGGMFVFHGDDMIGEDG